MTLLINKTMAAQTKLPLVIFLSIKKLIFIVAFVVLKLTVSLLQKHPFILMYEERFVDVASYVCRILDQIPASPISPMYVD